MAGELKYAPIYFDNIEVLEMLPDEAKGKLFMALLAFSAGCAKGEEPDVDLSEMDLASKVAYKSMIKDIKRCYEVLLSKSKNGSKGGRPAKEESEENLIKPDETELNRNKANETESNRNGEYKDEDEINIKANKKKLKDEVKDEGDIANAISAEPLEGSTPVICIPLNDGTEYPVSESEVQTWESLYPAVDVMQELRGMVGWSMSHPQQRKTKRGVLKFINTWLSKEQDRGPGKLTPRAAPKQQSFTEAAEELARDLEKGEWPF